MTDNESQYINLLAKRFRAITYNWDVLSLYGDESKLYCLTDFQVAWLLSNTDYYRWSTRWSNSPLTQAELDAQKAELEYNLMNCFDTRWMGQLDYVYNQVQGEQLQVLEDAYDIGGIAGINASTPTDYYSGDDSDNRIAALCMACDTYVRSYLNNWLTSAATLIGLVSILGVFVASTPFIGLIAGIIVGGFVFMTQVAIDACNDEDAVSDVVCCMFNGLNGLSITQANFEIALSACAFVEGSNQAIVRDIVASDLSQDKNWYSFLNALGNSYNLMQAGVDFVCPCIPTPPTFSHTFVFEATTDGWTIQTYGDVYTFYLISTHVASLNEESINIDISWGSPRTLKSFDATVQFANNRVSAFKEAGFFDGSATPGVLVADWDVTTYNTPITLSWSGTRVGKTYMRFRTTSRNAADNYLFQITVTGEGTDPF